MVFELILKITVLALLAVLHEISAKNLRSMEAKALARLEPQVGASVRG